MSTTQLDFDEKVLLHALESKDSTLLKELLEQIHHADLADVYAEIGLEGREQLAAVAGSELFADILPDLPDHLREEALELFAPEQQVELLGAVSDDDLADILQDVPLAARKKYLSLLNPEDKKVVDALLQYGEETAGGRMTTHYGRVHIRMSIAEAIEELRGIEDDTPNLGRIYVVDDDGVLLGKVRLRHLAFSDRSKAIEEVMLPIQNKVLASADQEEAIQMFIKYDMYAVPVVNEHDHLLGVITHDDAMEIFEQEFTEDIEKMAGVSGEHSDASYLHTGVFVHFQRRFPWLFILALLAILSGFVMLKYDDLLKNVYILALYLPMVVAAGGNTGGQAATMVTRALALGEIEQVDLLKVAWKEMRLGFMLGCLLGSLIGLITFVLVPMLPSEFGSLPEGLTIQMFVLTTVISLAVQITSSTLTGAMLPLIASKFKIDPAVVASPAITTIVDVTGLVIYFSVASMIML